MFIASFDTLVEISQETVFTLNSKIDRLLMRLSIYKNMNNDLRYKLLFENMLNGFAYCKMLYNSSDIPEDFIYLDVNPAFETSTGLSNVVGKKVTEVIPGIKNTNPDLFAVYGRVAKTGKPEQLESYVPELAIYFSISVYTPEKDHFVAVFENITERKKTETALQEKTKELQKYFELTVGRELQMVDLKKKIQELEEKK